MIVSGVSGGGKRAVQKHWLNWMDDHNIDYCLLAPTGASALRVTAQTSKRCNTIHRQVLKYKEINADVIYIDEMSMVYLDTFCMLLNAITNPNAKIIMAGDPFQLPAINMGCVFSDLIKSDKIPSSHLTQVFRYNTDVELLLEKMLEWVSNFLIMIWLKSRIIYIPFVIIINLSKQKIYLITY
jgi:exodeoxyribonuclease V alpha subunit